MGAYYLDWLNLFFRWFHVISGIAWIGASFYFIWLDNHLQTPPDWKTKKGVKGDLWAIHGGGIYEVAKYQLSPEKMPDMLHWFKWEAYTTWLTGMVLLTIIYYLGADSYLIDPRIAELSQIEAVSIGLTFIFGSYILYEVLCTSPIGRSGLWTAIILGISGIIIAYYLTKLFSGRGAYIHFGAIIGTIMAGNVFRVIMPSQRALVKAIKDGSAPDPKWGKKAKLHSTHNTYLTLPLIFIMISSHYPMTYAHSFNWAILICLVAITALVRYFFILKHKKITEPLILVGTATATVILAVGMSPKPSTPSAEIIMEPPELIAAAHSIVQNRCVNCHAASPADTVFKTPPSGVLLETLEQMRQWAPRIQARTVDTHDMPFMNKTGMLDEERTLLGQWIADGAQTGRPEGEN